MTLLQLIERVIAILQNVLSIVGVINANTQQAARENVPFEIATSTSVIQSVVTDGTFGNAALQAAIATLSGQLAIDVTAILTAIGTPQQAGVPVTLPATPPSGWGPAVGGDVANAVWDATAGGWPFGSMGEAGSFAGKLSFNLGANSVLPWQQQPLFLLDFPYYLLDTTAITSYPHADPSTILATDTALTWLTRVAPTFAWSDTLIGDGFVAALDSPNNALWILNLNPAQFDALRLFFNPSAARPIPPVWPGLANVVLGTPVAIATGVTITAPMDGVLIDITAAPAKQGSFSFDAAISWRNVGALAFVSDNGQEEYPQTLGFEQAVYCPRAMVTAAGLVFRSIGGLSGTITPWSLA